MFINRSCNATLCVRNIIMRSVTTKMPIQTEDESTEDRNGLVASKSINMLDKYPFEKFDDQLRTFFIDKSSRTPFPVKSSSLSNYISDSKALQFLAKINMDLNRVEKKHKDLNFLVMLRLHEDIGAKLKFLRSNGIAANSLGNVLTKNPYILDPKVLISDFKENLAYLRSKKFLEESINSIILKFPQILTIPVERLDGMLGFYQRLPTKFGEKKRIHFSGDELRAIITRYPTLLEEDTSEVYDRVRLLEISCGFSHMQIKEMVVKQPSILLTDQSKIEDVYKFFTRVIGLDKNHISSYPMLFNNRPSVALPRHMYLKHIGRNIYHWNKPGYVEVTYLVIGNNKDFCENLNLNYKEYLKFLRTV